MSRIFILSPANCGGRRAKQALSPNATFALAQALRSADGASLGDVFTFVSGLYFRGKLTYARRFANPPDPTNTIVGGGVHVITPNAAVGYTIVSTSKSGHTFTLTKAANGVTRTCDPPSTGGCGNADGADKW